MEGYSYMELAYLVLCSLYSQRRISNLQMNKCSYQVRSEGSVQLLCVSVRDADGAG